MSKDNHVVETIGGIVLFILLFIGFGFAGYIENHYTRDAYVCDISREEIVFCDNSGLEYAIDYEEGYSQGDEVKVTFFTNYTDDNRYDDVITKVKKK